MQDWINECITAERAAELREAVELQKARFAQASAPRLFACLTRTIETAIREYRSTGGKHNVQYEFKNLDPRQFAARRSAYPAITLKLDLNEITIESQYWRQRDHTSKGVWSNTQCFRVIADLAGNAQIVQGDSRFPNISELAMLLLRPVLEY